MDTKSTIGIMVIVGYFVALYMLFFVDIPAASKDLLIATTGALTVMAKDVVGYFFGTSEGSARKTELLAQAPAIQEVKPNED